MSATKNECEIVNRLSRKVEKELAENMEEINEKIKNVAVIDDTTASETTTYSSNKINNELSAKASINDTTASNITTYSSNKIDSLISYNNYATYYTNETTESNTFDYKHDTIIDADGFYIINSIVNAKVTDSSKTHPGKLFVYGSCEVNLNRNNETYTITKESKLASLDFTNVTNHTYVNDIKNIIFKNNASLFLKAGDVINIKNFKGTSDITQTWKFTSSVNIYRIS
jgi:hypothetical protein